MCDVAHVAAKQGFLHKPPPAWVHENTAPVASFDESGVTVKPATESRYLLIDNQTRASSTGIERYRHYLRRVASTADLGQLAQLSFDFEPSFQQLIIHHIRIRRGNNVIDVFEPREVKITQQENELDQQLYNGTFSAVIFLKDVRVGDVIDFAYTVTGDNPVLGGQFADSFVLAAGVSADQVYMRLLYPTGRRIYFRNHGTDLQPGVQQIGADTEYVWQQRDVSATESEDMVPSWFDSVPGVQMSEFGEWSEVVNWALPLYQSEGVLPSELTSQIAKWQNELPTPEARVLAARRFVQDEVRYLGIELGDYSHKPTSPVQVFRRRFGDCKDKSLLLATILNRMNIEAYPALVNTDAASKLDDWQPSPYSFDHVIVQAHLDGKTYWIDPTISYQRGALSEESNLNYARALVIREGETALSEIPLRRSDSPTTTIAEIYNATDFESPVTRDITSVYRATDADSMRYYLAGQSLDDLNKSYLNYYAEREPSIESRGLPEVTDDEQANIITIKEHYIIPQFWKGDNRNFLADRIYQELDKPNTTRRTMPLRVSFPLNIEQNIQVNLPRRLAVWTGSKIIESNALRFEYAATMNGDTLSLDYKLRTKLDAIAPEEVAKHLEKVEKAQQYVEYKISPNSSGAATLQGTGFVAALFIIGLLGAGGFILYRKNKRRGSAYPSGIARVEPGAHPETAIAIGDEAEIASKITKTRCRCGAHNFAAAERQKLRYDDKQLVFVPLKCRSCQNAQDVYFAYAN